MKYEEDPFYDKEYQKTIDLLMGELDFVTDLFRKEKLENFNEATFVNYANSEVLGTVIKLMNYFLVIKEGDLHKLSKYIPKLEELKTYLEGSKDGVLMIYGINIDELSSPERKKYELELAQIDPELTIKMDKRKLIGLCKIILELCSNIVKLKPLLDNKRKLITHKTSIKRTEKINNTIQNFSNKLSIRRENINCFFTKVENNLKKTGGKLQVTEYLSAYYEHYKMVKTSLEAEKNIYIISLKDENNPEMMSYSYNLCAFIHNQLNGEWCIDSKNQKFTLIESLINTLFISTKSIQFNLLKVIKETGNTVPMLDKIWIEMKWTMSFVKFKTTIDKYWKEAFKRCMILIKFHQFLCEDNNSSFKELMKSHILPTDTIDRVQRWTTIFQRMSDNCQWHYNYVKGEINDFERSHRPYLFPLATGVFDNLAELCSGPCTENQLKIYTFIYDRYNGFLQRYWRDPNTQFYKAKLHWWSLFFQ